MKFKQLYSSSGGNLYTVTGIDNHRLLIECGVSWKKIQKALDYDLSNIDACILSHEHQDHSKAIHDIIKSGIDVYASEGTFDALEIDTNNRRTNIIYNKQIAVIKNFRVMPFNVYHDALEPYGYIIRSNGDYMLFATDTARIKQKIDIAFKIIAVECSYNADYLQDQVDVNNINIELAKRLRRSHFSKQDVIKFLNRCNLSECEEIHLLHMSSSNIDKEKTRKEIEDRFFIKTIAKG